MVQIAQILDSLYGFSTGFKPWEEVKNRDSKIRGRPYVIHLRTKRLNVTYVSLFLSHGAGGNVSDEKRAGFGGRPVRVWVIANTSIIRFSSSFV